MERTYHLEVENRSNLNGNVCIYQTDPVQEKERIYSVAWFSKPSQPDSITRFQWEPQYAFVWSDTGLLQPGVRFQANEIKPIDLSIPAVTARAFTVRDGTPEFSQTNEFIPAGEIGLLTDGAISERKYAIGVSMDGNPVFAMTARPNMDVTFRPHPRYWVAFGSYQQGEVMDINRSAVLLPPDSPENNSYKFVIDASGELKLERI